MANNPKLAKLDYLKSQVRGRLAEYISRFREVKPGRNFCCINPAHADHNPSCGIVPGNPELFHCFTCQTVGDVLTAANMLEGKPLAGPGFVVENLFYLAKMFGMETPDLELTADEQHDMDTYRAYATAANILITTPRGDRVADKLQDYGWTAETQKTYGVGCVESFEAYMKLMTQVHGYDRSFLKSIDLDNKKIFSPDCLVFVVSDEHGQPVGFAARNLLFDSLKKDWQRAVADFGADSEAARQAKDKLPAKFVNSSQQSGETELKNRIYQKSKRLYGFHLARKQTPPLYVFEGYADAATAYNTGLRNACAIGATAFTPDHLEMLLDQGIDHVVFVLDADDAGYKGTDRFVKTLKEHLGGNVGFKAQIVVLPEGSDDPDAFIRSRGLDAFLGLPRIDLFQWELQRAIAGGEDPDKIFEATVPLIVNEPNNLKRLRMAESLAGATGIRADVVWAEVQRLNDLDGQKIKTELNVLAERTSKMLLRSPDKIYEILMDSQRQAERINTMQQGYDLSRLTSYIDGIMDEAEAHTSDHELKLGYPIFDKCFGGIPHTDAFISIPGKPNQGKSSFLCNIAHRLVDNNDNVIVLYHTVDDAMRWFLPRLLGSRYRVASDYFYKAGYYLATNPLVAVNGGDKQQFRDVYADAKKWFRTKLAAERLLPFDASMLDQNVFSLEMRVRDLRKKYPTTPIVVFGDNFHLYTNPAVKEDGEAKTRGLSMACKNLANVHHVTVIMTMELPKSALEEGKRPRMMNIKGSAGISYDASANIGVYNDQKDLRERAELTWDEDVEPTEIAPGQMVTRIKRPILEMVFDKSKVNGGFDGNIYYAFHPTSGQVVECDALDQEKYRAKAARQQEQRKNPAPKGAQFTSGYLPSVEPAPMLAMTEEEAVRPFM